MSSLRTDSTTKALANWISPIQLSNCMYSNCHVLEGSDVPLSWILMKWRSDEVWNCADGDDGDDDDDDDDDDDVQVQVHVTNVHVHVDM